MSAVLTRARTVVLTLALAAGLLLAAAIPWFTATVPTVLAPETLTASGAQVLPVVAAGAPVVAATAVVLVIGGNVVRRLGGLVLVVTAGLVLGATVGLLRDPLPALERRAAEVTGLRIVAEPVTLGPGGYLTLGLAALLVVLGLLVLLGPRWHAAARRFERVAETAAADRADDTPRVQAMDDWDALGRGEDPSTP